ncbi:LuxR C-terminal-related transcriptional regulator [Mesobacterium sp. TK19101]|uniref:LuxR C-terminal-related transcriptional regulator n=1 Tax=Mesobacterium hydrothermale TaxID=3111907 RepID=A0ABU6HK74_9RHOB|nr:LuxR C-terminal-related transcriptional regulator [Mesobacterium sp. TK19101]MEC3862512.1 LuxR C-terminal-related transcriptional regulator [Mesobacterium sp. TK19101]
MTNQRTRPVAGTERFIPQHLLEFLVSLETTRSTNDVWDLILELAQSLRLTVVDYVYATDFRNWEQAQFIRTTFDSTWLDYVKQFPHIRHTSNFRMHAVHKLTPIMVGPAYLDEMGDISPEKRRHVMLSAKMGLQAGVGFPLRMGDPGQAAVLAFGGDFTRAEFDALMAEHGWTLHAAALSAHTRYTELFKAEFIERNELTEKQKELVRLVGQGLMDKQIAHELGISFSAVRQRLAAVQQKTGAQNRADLAALAMRVGLVADPLIRDHRDDLTVFLSMGDGKTGREVRPEPPATAAE